MVDLGLLSQNLVLILKALINNQNLLKYVVYDETNPLDGVDLELPYVQIIGEEGRMLPYPFDNTVEQVDCTNIRVYYPEGEIDESQVIAETYVCFDIIVAKSLWLISDGQSSDIRPYKIMNEIMKTFKDKSVDTVGRLKFTDFTHMSVNDKFHAIRLNAVMNLMKQGD
jgi:hypothetical protein